MNEENTIKYKSFQFAVRTVKLYKYLCKEKKEYVLSKQFLRSGTSIGANIAESECAISQKDFLAKVYIALKECAESIYCLDLLFEVGLINETGYHSMKKDCVEMKRMLSSTTKTIVTNEKKTRSTSSRRDD